MEDDVFGITDDRIWTNGIDATTGDYLLRPLKPRQVASVAMNEEIDSVDIAHLKRVAESLEGDFEAQVDDPNDLEKAGWGVIFHPDVSEDVKKALSPLLELRRSQAKDLYKDFADRPYQPSDDKFSFLRKSQGTVHGRINPRRCPYYLMIVGDPESIPFRFQYQLDVQYAVGRIHFDTVEEYAEYAQNVVASESGETLRKRDLAFFGVRNHADRATQLSTDMLIDPLCQYFRQREPSRVIRRYIADDATKESLRDLLGGSQTPSLLVTGSHGMGFPNGDSAQLSEQGAILCQNWPGPRKHRGRIPREFYFAANDISDDCQLNGLVAMFFACYGAGTPSIDEFAHRTVDPQASLTTKSFVASLPKKLLSRKHGASAVIGHVDRAWTYSFAWEGNGEQLTTFQDSISALLAGNRVGLAMEFFNKRYAQVSSDLTLQIEQRRGWPKRPDYSTIIEDQSLAGLWTANNDARSYIVVGDPAVRCMGDG